MSDRPPRERAGLASIVAWSLLGGGALLVTAVTTFWLAMHLELRSNTVEVPDVVGKSREDAEAALRAVRLEMEVAAERHDVAVSSGRVLTQEPAASVTVRPGRRIRVVVSLGNQVLRVPDVRGLPARQVDLSLRQDGFVPGGEAHVFAQDVPAGNVIAQAPAPGSVTIPGSRVHRLVSDGPRPASWVMPDLSGRPLREVEQWVTLCGFRKGPVRRLATPGKPSGVVVGQMPLAGHPIRARDVIELAVAE